MDDPFLIPSTYSTATILQGSFGNFCCEMKELPAAMGTHYELTSASGRVGIELRFNGKIGLACFPLLGYYYDN